MRAIAVLDVGLADAGDDMGVGNDQIAADDKPGPVNDAAAARYLPA